jgi:hypothetical protein
VVAAGSSQELRESETVRKAYFGDLSAGPTMSDEPVKELWG